MQNCSLNKNVCKSATCFDCTVYSHHQVEHIIVKIINVIQCNKIVRTRSGLTLTYRCIKLYKISKLSLMMAVYTAETCSWFAHR